MFISPAPGTDLCFIIELVRGDGSSSIQLALLSPSQTNLITVAPPLHAVKATSSRPFKPGSVHHCPIVLVGLFFSQSCSPLLSSAIIVWLPTPFAATLAGCRSVAAPEGGPFVGTAFVELKRVPVPPPPPPTTPLLSTCSRPHCLESEGASGGENPEV